MPRREEQLLLDILAAADEISQFLAGVGQERFLQEPLIRNAVLYDLTIIGEAAARLPRELQARHPEVPWADIIGFRNIIVHAYFAVDWQIVWVAATRNVPDLRRSIAAIIAQEFPQLPIPEPPQEE